MPADKILGQRVDDTGCKTQMNPEQEVDPRDATEGAVCGHTKGTIQS